jgi:diguanylate cyclase (GGDEF)-like protein
MESGRPEAKEASDHEAFRASVAELDRVVKSSFRATALQITAVIVAIVAPFMLESPEAKRHFSAGDVAYSVLILILAVQICELFRHGHTEQIRERLAKQLKVAVMQKIRANSLYDLSILDSLTGLHNRRFGEQRLQEEVARSERNDEPLAVLLFDLDCFKEINDQCGHAAGDAALKEFSRKLKRAIRACDVPVRVGGDEFLVILPECPREKVDMIVDRIGSPEVRFNEHAITVQYSVGRAHYQINDTSHTMLQRADRMLYAQKASRRTKAGVRENKTNFGAEQTVGYERPPSFRT